MPHYSLQSNKMLGRIFLVLAVIGTMHAAFSTYEHFSRLKALDRPEGSVPTGIALETGFALCLGILGAALSVPPLKEISWSNEMRNHKIDDMDSRLGFANYVNRGSRIFQDKLKSRTGSH